MLASIKMWVIRGARLLGLSSKLVGAPRGAMMAKDWWNTYGYSAEASWKTLEPEATIQEPPPVTLESEVHPIYANEFSRVQPEAFVLTLPNGRVWGRNGTVITSNDWVIADVSREFGRYKGVMGPQHSIFRRLYLGKCTRVEKTVAVVSTSGSYNFYHWMYDVLPRFALLQQSGYWSTIDAFVVDYTGSSFQQESLKRLGIDESKIIRSNDQWRFHIEAAQLIVPALPSVLSTMNPWAVDFLRRLFLADINPGVKSKRLYISREKAPSRKLIQEGELKAWLEQRGFVAFFPEQHSVAETAELFRQAEWVIGVHGAGFANLAFCSSGAKVLDIVAPRHVDGIYWMLSNRVGARYGYLFGLGERPAAGTDLVAHKVDADVSISLDEFKTLFNQLEALG